MSKGKILVVDDNVNICDLLRMYLEKEDFEAVIANNGNDAIKAFEENCPDLILLDIMLPGLDGWQVCREIRKTSDVPIIMVTAKDETFDKVLGLELGADDYVTKPFGTRELMARVKANLRRRAVNDEEGADKAKSKDDISFGGLTINMKLFEVKKNGKTIDLTLREYELLKFLASQKTQVFSRETLLQSIWGFQYDGDTRIVDVHVFKLKGKLKESQVSFKSVRGVGYKLVKKDDE